MKQKLKEVEQIIDQSNRDNSDKNAAMENLKNRYETQLREKNDEINKLKNNLNELLKKVRG